MNTLSFQKSKWIWENQCPSPDEYAEFCASFSCDKSQKQTLLISADSDYVAFLNGEQIAFGQYPCYPDDKYGDEIDISDFVKDGENKLSVLVWYYGVNSMTYQIGPACVRFEVRQGDNVLAFSSEKTQSRIAPGYLSHKERKITSQLGLGYAYDATQNENTPFSDSVSVSSLPETVKMRPIQKTVLCPRTPFTRVMGGTFTLVNPVHSVSEDMAQASLRFHRNKRDERFLSYFTSENEGGDGIWFVVDIGREEAGFLDFDITVPQECDVWIAYGEHLQDGRVRTFKRDFSCSYHAQKGRNTFLNCFRRFGCRYLQFFVFAPSVRVDYAGIRPVEYPLEKRDIHTGNLLRDRILDTCVRTLSLCMHEHYEDCPWREQALYTMDSRNQALCGYYAFGETAFPRASFRLMSSHLRKDGLLCLCAPGGDDAPIPAFSCAYFIEMDEYIRYSGDISLAKECYPAMTTVMNTFLSHRRENGLCLNFYAKENSDYWNFYEWSDTMNGRFKETEPSFEAPLNAFVSLALQSFASVCRALGKTAEAEKYEKTATELNGKIRECFFRSEDKLFDSFLERDAGTYSVLTNALCLLCGAADGADTSVIEKIMASNGASDTGLRVVPNTISMNIYRFDAMLKANAPKYAQAILDEIDREYFKMLCAGATSFWETQRGADDFDCVGSLCHGWSALPIYYYDILIKKYGCR